MWLGYFRHALLEEANFSNTKFDRTNFVRSILDEAHFANAILHNVDFEFAVVDSADFTGADLSTAKFRGTFYNQYTKWPDNFNIDEITKVTARLTREDIRNGTKSNWWEYL
jgi:uncharacterized protein YjbI with pentapeptide repeats